MANPQDREGAQDREPARTNPCGHPETVAEVLGRFRTGDKICTTCGAVGPATMFADRDVPPSGHLDASGGWCQGCDDYEHGD